MYSVQHSSGDKQMIAQMSADAVAVYAKLKNWLKMASFLSVFRIRSDPYHLAGLWSTFPVVDPDPGSKNKSW